MNTLNDKHILLGITGGIAAYKSADLVRRLREQGAEVRVVMTRAAKEFITPLTMQALSGNPVNEDLLDPKAEAGMGHIELARWADLIMVAPASADFIARLAHGFADDLLSTLCLATSAPIMLAPAMNQQMWSNKATQDNINILIERGMQLIGPAAGLQACGDVGLGRMLEPLEIINHIAGTCTSNLLQSKKIIITAGPTQEAIDPVRYLSNRSSGKMGFALAEAAVSVGAQVYLIAGPVNLATPANVKRIDVQTAEQMQQAVLAEIAQCDIFIGVAAVADYRSEKPSKQKLKKSETDLQLKLVRNTDILSTVANLKKPPFVIGFAAETNDVIKNAKEKLQKKKLDMIVANEVGEQKGFASDNNEVTVIWEKGQRTLVNTSKKQIAKQLIEIIAERYKK